MAGAANIRAGGAFVEIFAEDSKLIRGLRSASAKVAAFGSGIAGVGAGVAAAGAAITAPFTLMAKEFADAGSALFDMSARTGASVEGLSELSFAAGQSGTDMATVEGAFRKMARALQAGSEENIEAEATFQALGLSVKELGQLSPDEQFRAIAEAIGEIPDPTAKAAVALQIFGKSGTALLPMIQDMAALSEQARDLGLVMSEEDAKAADALGDSMDTVTALVKRMGQIIGASIAPLLTKWSDNMIDVVKAANVWADQNRPLVESIFNIATWVGIAGTAIIALGSAVAVFGVSLGGIATLLTTVGAAFAFLVTTPGLVIAALAGLTTWFITSTEAGGAALQWLGKQFGTLAADATQAFGGISDALKAGDIALAGQILWAELKVEWLKGIQFINGLMADWGVAIQEVFAPISTIVASVFINAWATIQSAFVKALDFMGVGFSDFVGTITQMWNNFSGFFSEVWARLKGLFAGGDVEAEVARIKDETARANAEAAAKAASGPGNQGKLAQIEQQRVDSQAALANQAAADSEARRKAAAGAVMAGAADLQAAQDELGGLTDKAGLLAALNRQGSALEAEAGKAGKAGLPTPEDIGKGLDQAQAKAKVDVAGSFSGLAAMGLGVGQSVIVAEDQLKEQKKTNDHLEKLVKKTEAKEATFAT